MGEERTRGGHVGACFGQETGMGDGEGGKVMMVTSSEAASSLELDSDSTTGGEITGARLGRR